MKKTNSLVNVLFEGAVVKRINRTGWQILGDHEENVGEHSFMTSVISYFIAKMKNVPLEKVLVMAIFHDFHEARTGELDKVAQFYVSRDQDKANSDIFVDIDPELLNTLNEYETKKSVEARIAYEANILALLLELKILVQRGHLPANEWMEGTVARLKLPESQQLAQEILATDPHAWWKSVRSAIIKELEEEK